MTNRIPLIVNPGAAQIQELASTDALDLGTANIVNATSISATYLFGDGSNISNISGGGNYSNANVKAYLEVFDGNIIPLGNNVYSLGSLTNQWANLFLSGNTVYFNGYPLSGFASNVITYNGNPLVSINQAGNIVIPGAVVANGFAYANGAPFTGNYGDANVELLLEGGTLANNITTTGNISGSNISAGTNNLFMTGNTIATPGNIVIDPLNDGTLNGNVVVLGNLQVTGNLLVVNANTAVIDNLVWVAANAATNQFMAAGGGLQVGPSPAPYANLIYNATSNIWTTNIGLNANGNVYANSFVSDVYTYANGVSIINDYSNANVQLFLDSGLDTANIITTANIIGANIGNTTTYLWGDGSNITGITGGYGNANVELLLETGIANNIITTGNIIGANIGNIATFLYGDGSNITNIAPGNIILNGNSSVSIPVSNGNITMNVAGVTNTVVITGTSLFANTVRNDTGNTANVVYYNAVTQELTYAPVVTGVSNVIAFGTSNVRIASSNGSILGVVGTSNALALLSTGQVALGVLAGNATQGSNAIAIGGGAGKTSQSTQAVAVGAGSGQTSQGSQAVAVGYLSAANTQSAGAVAVGYNAGNNTQGTNAVAIGINSGANVQGTSAVAIGDRAGNSAQGTAAVAIGQQAGQTNQGVNAITIGIQSGFTGQAANAISIGYGAGQTNQGADSVAIGTQSGINTQGAQSVAIGGLAGRTTQQPYAVAIGYQAGWTGQSSGTVAVGWNAGLSGQGANSIAIGFNAGTNNFPANAIGIGYGISLSSTAVNAIAIGSRPSISQSANSIVINASGTSIGGSASGFFVTPVRNDTSTAGTTNIMYYNTSTSEITYGATTSTLPAAATGPSTINSVSVGTLQARLNGSQPEILSTIAGQNYVATCVTVKNGALSTQYTGISGLAANAWTSLTTVGGGLATTGDQATYIISNNTTLAMFRLTYLVNSPGFASISLEKL